MDDDDGPPAVRLVTIAPKPSRPRLSFVTVVRSERVLVFRHHWARAFNIKPRELSRSEDSKDHCVEPTQIERTELRRLAAESTATKVTLADVDWLARITPGCSSEFVTELTALARWAGPTELAARPPVAEEDDSSDDEISDDEEDDPEAHAARYGLTGAQRESGVTGLHFRRLRAYLRDDFNLNRPSELGHTTVENTERVAALFMGFEAPADATKIGFLCSLDGARVWRFVKHLRDQRELKFSTLEQYLRALARVVDFTITEVLDQRKMEWAVDYTEAFTKLVKRTESNKSRRPNIKKTFRELLESHEFVRLEEILKRTVPFILTAIETFKENPTTQTAMGLRNATLLALTAGDSWNVRPGELAHLCDHARGGTCFTPGGCGIVSCTGNTVRILESGGIEMILPHHKTVATTGRVRPRFFGQDTVVAQALTLLIREGAPLLRGTAGGSCIILKEDGSPLKAASEATKYITRTLVRAGKAFSHDNENILAKLSSRDVRYATIVHIRDHPELYPPELGDDIAEDMGHSRRQWLRYDLDVQDRGMRNASAAAERTLGPLCLPSMAAPPAASATDPSPSPRGRTSGSDLHSAMETAAESVTLMECHPHDGTAALSKPMEGGPARVPRRGQRKVWFLKPGAQFISEAEFDRMSANHDRGGKRKIFFSMYDGPEGASPAMDSTAWLKERLCGIKRSRG
jgi:hypothetical protein